MNERDKVKVKITALLNKTAERGCNEHEALAAAQKAAELMAHYDIEATELDFKSRSCVKKTTNKPKYGNKLVGSYISMAVAKLCDCRCWGSGSSELTFFGFEQDAEIAVYLFELLANTIMIELRTYQQSDEHAHLKYHQGYHGRSLAASFLYGIEDRICDRIYAMAKEKRDEVKTSGSTDLVPVKTAQIDDEFSDLGLNLRRSSRSVTARSSAAIRAGNSAGSRVNIGAGVSGRRQGAIS